MVIPDDRSESRWIPFHEPAWPNVIADTIKKHSAENKEALTAVAPKQVRERLSMDLDWKFSLGHATDIDKDFDYLCGGPAINAKTGDPAGPSNPGFDYRDWQHINLPHDWVVGLEYDSLAESLCAYKKIGRKYPENCIFWYRKTFDIPAEDLGVYNSEYRFVIEQGKRSVLVGSSIEDIRLKGTINITEKIEL